MVQEHLAVIFLAGFAFGTLAGAALYALLGHCTNRWF